MEYIDNLFLTNNDDYDNDEISFDQPVGWSSICFKQTLNYYIEHNAIYNNDELEEKQINKD